MEQILGFILMGLGACVMFWAGWHWDDNASSVRGVLGDMLGFVLVGGIGAGLFAVGKLLWMRVPKQPRALGNKAQRKPPGRKGQK